MQLMLVVIFSFLALGLLAPRIGRREQWIIAAIAVLMACLYFFPSRFM
jgi:hypothetical protein